MFLEGVKIISIIKSDPKIFSGKSDAEIIAFFRYAGEKTRQNAHRPQQRSVDARGRQLLQGLVSSLVGFELGVLRIGKPNSRCS